MTTGQPLLYSSPRLAALVKVCAARYSLASCATTARGAGVFGDNIGEIEAGGVYQRPFSVSTF